MRRAQLLICENDGRLAQMLRERIREQGWSMREVRHAPACLGLLRPGEPAVFVLKVGRDLEREFTVLEQVTRRFPQTAVIVVGDAENPTLAELAWDLGARYVLFPPQLRQLLLELVTDMMTPKSIQRDEEN